eukprot:TRINITY_DN32054_c0_g1_i2.p2 TRINITY_DN32054_c0_g1~~TRINITY_DN32054_c0_g1_i2.p2  ORF type:complete len:202 (+),score=46.32 TRINITY_DN32054_c0_g1_i2:776-1381(+)
MLQREARLGFRRRWGEGENSTLGRAAVALFGDEASPLNYSVRAHILANAPISLSPGAPLLLEYARAAVATFRREYVGLQRRARATGMALSSIPTCWWGPRLLSRSALALWARRPAALPPLVAGEVLNGDGCDAQGQLLQGAISLHFYGDRKRDFPRRVSRCAWRALRGACPSTHARSLSALRKQPLPPAAAPPPRPRRRRR